jgi:hypothetical protein
MNASTTYTSTVSRVRSRIQPNPAPHTYRVDDDGGHCLYRGYDLGLADEICGSGPGLHLTVLTGGELSSAA